MEYPLWKQFSNIEQDWHIAVQFLFLYVDMSIFQKLKSLKFFSEKKIILIYQNHFAESEYWNYTNDFAPMLPVASS